MNRTLNTTIISLILNILYSLYYIVTGVITFSWWLLTVGTYYCILSVLRFVVIHSKRNGHILTKFSGYMLMVTSLPLVGTVILSYLSDRGQNFHMIVMIAIATYTFTKITLATIGLIKSRNCKSEKIITLRNISFADAFVSIFSLQRSMLVSFEGMRESEILLMNTLTGCSVCIVVFLLGFNLVKRKRILFDSINS